MMCFAKEFDVRNEHGHYVLYVDGKFYGSYDTITEASEDIEELRKNEDAT